MDKSKKRSNCLISGSLDIFGDKWSLLIIRDLMLNKTRMYSEFVKSEEKIATNILASKLQGLEEHGIVAKLPFPGNKVKALYILTPKGIELIPVIIEITIWAKKNNSDTKVYPPFLQEVEKNKSKFLKKIMGELTATYNDKIILKTASSK